MRCRRIRPWLGMAVGRCSSLGAALVESLVRSVRVVVLGVLGQDPSGVVFVVDQDAVGALAADGAHESWAAPRFPDSSY